MHIAPSHTARRRVFAASLTTALLAALPSARAAAITWVGSTDTNLATAANWSGAVAPVSGDSWVFGAPGTAGATLTNTLTSTSFNVAGITFGTAATTGYTIGGNAFVLTGNITDTNTAAVSHTISNAIEIAAGAHTFSVGGGGNTVGLVLSGNLTGSGTISQTGSGSGVSRLTLAGDNSGFTGAFSTDNASSTRTTINSAASGSAAAAWTFNKVVNGGVSLAFSNTTVSFGSLAGGGNIRADADGTVTVSVGALDTSTTFSGILQQANGSRLLALTKVGTGTLTLSGANTATAVTTISGGTLQIGAGGTAGVIASTSIVNNATLAFNRSDAIAYSAVISGTGAVNKLGAGTLTLSGANTYTGNTTVSAGGLTISNTGSLVFDVNNASNTQLLGSGALNFDGTLKLDLSDVSVGSGSWNLIDVGGLSESFGATFSVVDKNGLLTFTELANVWTSDNGLWSFNEGTGVLTLAAIPEPSTCALILGAAGLGAAASRRRNPVRR